MTRSDSFDLSKFAREVLTLGIDIGNAGGLALMTADGSLVAVEAVSVLQDGPRSRPTVKVPLLAAIVRRWARAPLGAVVGHGRAGGPEAR